MSAGRNTAVRDKNRAVIRKSRAACGICGDAIDYELPNDDPMSFVVDHIIPRVHGGSDDITNAQAAHKRCNASKGARPDESPIDRGNFLVWPTA